MTRKALIPQPGGEPLPRVRFYVAQYDAMEGEYYGLCMLRSNRGGYIEYRDYLKHAMVDAEVFTSAGETVHCIYEVNGLTWKRHEFTPAVIDRGSEWGEW